MKSNKKFDDLGLSEQILDAIKQKGFGEPTEIQALTIPRILRNDSNIIAQAQTGTGKTAAFGLPLIDMIDPDSKAVQALVLVPTRELAIQVADEIDSLKGNKAITVMPVYGGQFISQQFRGLKNGVHIIVGSPGRVIDHLNRKTLKLDSIDHLILDEADEMLNMGFIDDMEEIMKHTNPNKKTLLFSATMPTKIKDLAHKYMDGYDVIKVKEKQLTTDLTDQKYFEVRTSDRFEVLCRIIDIESEFYGLVFCRTKNDVDSITAQLADRGYNAESIHGDISQSQRERTLDKFKKQRINILVATDVAARGIDVNNLSHVINYSLPHDPESYVHRIGRTGRAGKQGTAITFITSREYHRLMFIQRMAKTSIRKAEVPKIKDIITTKKKKIYDDLHTLITSNADSIYVNWAEQLLKDNDPAKVLAGVLNYCFKKELNPDTYNDIKETSGKNRFNETGGKRGFNENSWKTRFNDPSGRRKQARTNGNRAAKDQHGNARLFVALGKKDNVNARKIVDMVMSRVSVQSKHISDVRIMDKFSFISVPFDKAEKIVFSFKENEQKPLITHAKQN
ncbi:DEAD/DEAH box helicase [Thermoproteota archaeon]